MTVAIEITPRRRVQPMEQHTAGAAIVVGKDILELLSSAMYVDPLTLFREYVQNAADAIDDAIQDGLLSGPCPGRIDISLDSTLREIRVRDNGTGLPNSSAESVLTAFGASKKRGGTARGFRGVGRLAALGYAQFVVFRCKAKGQSVATEVTWDCRKLKSILLDSGYDGQLRDVVCDVVTIATHGGQRLDEHYFEVRLEKVVRVRNDLLLNPTEVRSYLSQVVPAPLGSDLPFADEIVQHLKGHVPTPTFRIHLEGSDEHVVRPLSREFVIRKGRIGEITGVELQEIKAPDGTLKAIGWILDHDYAGALHGSPTIRGLRARIGDIQVGGSEVFAEAFPERRFCSWTIGELHILDPRVIPNARRDDFEQNAAYYELVSYLAPLGNEIARKCRISSARRNRLKVFNSRATKAKELIDLLKQGAIRKSAGNAARREIGACFRDMAKVATSEILPLQTRKKLDRRLASLRKRYGVMGAEGTSKDLFGEFPKAKRAAYEEVIGLIYECAANRAAAAAMVDRIAARLAAANRRKRKPKKPS